MKIPRKLGQIVFHKSIRAFDYISIRNEGRRSFQEKFQNFWIFFFQCLSFFGLTFHLELNTKLQKVSNDGFWVPKTDF